MPPKAKPDRLWSLVTIVLPVLLAANLATTGWMLQTAMRNTERLGRLESQLETFVPANALVKSDQMSTLAERMARIETELVYIRKSIDDLGRKIP